MRVLYLTLSYHGGGAERCSRELFHLMSARGIDAQMFVCGRSADDPPQVRALQTRPERYLKALQYVRKPLDWCHIGSIRALDAVDQKHFDVVHAHNLHGNWLSLKAVQRLATRIPFVWTLHDEWAVCGQGYYQVPPELGPERTAEFFGGAGARYNPSPAVVQKQKAFLDRWMPRPSSIISPSRYLADLAREYPAFAGVEVEVVPNGVSILQQRESELPRDEAKASFGIDPKEKVILLAAADLKSPFKGVWLGLEMLKLLRTKGVRLLVLGKNAEPVIRQSPIPVTAPGFVRDAGTLAKAYRAADLTLMPSVAENFSYVALESLACQTPLLAFHIGGFEDLVGQNERGILVPPFDVAALANAAERMLHEPGLGEMLGNNGRTWAAKHCSMERFADAHLRIYENAIAKRTVQR